MCCRVASLDERILRDSEMKSGKQRRKPPFHKDKRRKHHHWEVTVYYGSGATFARTYIDRDKAAAFAKRQKKSAVVKRTRVVRLS